MDAPTNNQIDQLLAEFMGWTLRGSLWLDANGKYAALSVGLAAFSPTTNFNDTRDVLRKLTPEQWDSVIDRLGYIHMAATGCEERFSLWLLTCDPAIIARAVAEVVR